ncbi:hypothetical protein Peur_011570 [Populus x canadensis]
MAVAARFASLHAIEDRVAVTATRLRPKARYCQATHFQANSHSPRLKPDTFKPDYSYDPKPQPNVVKSHYGFDSKPNLDKIKLNIPKPDVIKPNYDSSPKPEPGNGYDSKPTLTNPSFPNKTLPSQIMVMIQKQMFPHQNPATVMTQNQN